MDLLSLTLRSLDLGNALSKKDDFLQAEDKDMSERSEASKDRRRRLKQGKEESWIASKEEKYLPTITLDEVAWHDTIDNCWLVIHDYVYDCTEFLADHPGGLDVLLEYAGRDATLPFIGTGHSKVAMQTLERHLIGELPVEERIFRVPDGVKITGLI